MEQEPKPKRFIKRDVAVLVISGIVGLVVGLLLNNIISDPLIRVVAAAIACGVFAIGLVYWLQTHHHEVGFGIMGLAAVFFLGFAYLGPSSTGSTPTSTQAPTNPPPTNPPPTNPPPSNPPPTNPPPTSPPPTNPPPTSYLDVIVDDTDRGFVREGPLRNWRGAAVGFAGHIWWTRPHQEGRVINTATWMPDLPAAGYWEVFAYVPSLHATARNAIYHIFHEDLQTHEARENKVAIDQSVWRDEWVSLGVFAFPEGTGAPASQVTLPDDTGDGRYHQIAADAIKWVWRGPGQ